ncbi:MAG: pyridoxine 5'-phosphate synthase [Bdellovibrionales bacterium]
MKLKFQGTRANKIRLGVNIDHVATLRAVRGRTTFYPDILDAAKAASAGGADQITIHLREDRRHIIDSDVKKICKDRPCLVNLEIAVTQEMFDLSLKVKPDWVCLVPEKRRELTTEGGLDVKKAQAKLKKFIPIWKKKGIKISLFLGTDPSQIRLAAELGADAIELHTGHWVLFEGAKKKSEWNRLLKAAHLTNELGMNVHAGHGLDLQSTAEIRKLPFLEELNIGHAIVCNSVFSGLKKATREFKNLLK